MKSKEYQRQEAVVIAFENAIDLTTQAREGLIAELDKLKDELGKLQDALGDEWTECIRGEREI